MQSRLAERLADKGFADIDTLVASTRPSLRLRTSPRRFRKLPLGASRFGGEPDLPPGFTWPEGGFARLVFVAQIDLPSLPASELPRPGWLLFFCEEKYDNDVSAIVHVTCAREQLTRANGRAHYPACSLTVHERLDLDLAVFDYDNERYLAEQAKWNPLLAVDGEARVGRKVAQPRHHLLGHDQPVEGPMFDQLDLDDPEGTGPWRLLLQIDSDKVPGFSWGRRRQGLFSDARASAGGRALRSGPLHLPVLLNGEVYHVSPSDRMRIGELSERAEVTPRTVRYYESIGLIPPGQREGHGQHY